VRAAQGDALSTDSGTASASIVDTGVLFNFDHVF